MPHFCYILFEKDGEYEPENIIAISLDKNKLEELKQKMIDKFANDCLADDKKYHYLIKDYPNQFYIKQQEMI